MQTVEMVDADQAWRAAEFPVTRSKIYLAHAAVSPLPRCTSEAVTRYVKNVSRHGQFEFLHREAEQEARSLAAGMLGVCPEEIAFTSSTSAGISMVAGGLDWQAGDNILLSQNDFPANVYAWENLAKRGVEIRRVAVGATHGVTVSDIRAAMDDHTRLVALPSIHYLTGVPNHIDSIGRYLRRQGVLFCVDAIQSLGAVKCSAEFVDFLAADAHKWLLGPQGIALLFVRRAVWSLLKPVLIGWKSVNAPTDYGDLQQALAPDARRYEPGSLNALGLVGLHASLSLLADIDIETIEQRIRGLRQMVCEELGNRGYDILGSESSLPSGIVTFRSQTRDMRLVKQRLTDQHIEVSVRRHWAGEYWLRVSPHFYNTPTEVMRFLEVLGPAR